MAYQRPFQSKFWMKILENSNLKLFLFPYYRGAQRVGEKLAKKKEKDPTVDDSSITKGILKWTWIYSKVYEFRNSIYYDRGDDDEDSDIEGEEENEDHVILDEDPELLEPSFFDYLCKTHPENDQECITDMGELDRLELKRALNWAGAQQQPAKKPAPWQYVAYDALPEEDRWAISCHEQPLCVYPDLFGDDFGFMSSDKACQEALSGIPSKRWRTIRHDKSAISSSLKLLKCMGSQATCHLHDGVTHVLCDLTVDSLSWRPRQKPDVFLDPQRGQKLLQRLEMLKAGELDPNLETVLLISPEWAERLWDEKHGNEIS